MKGQVYLKRSSGKKQDGYEHLQLDYKSLGLLVQEMEHHEVHLGRHFFLEAIEDQSINGVWDIQITVPDTDLENHFIFKIYTESETDVYLYEGATINTAGTVKTPRNNNRNSSNTSQLTIASITNSSLVNADADTDTSGATELIHLKSGSKQDGAGIERNREIVLKRDEIYTIRIVATVAGFTNLTLSWYEYNPEYDYENN